MNRKLRLLVSVILLGLLAWRCHWSQLGEVFRQLRVELWFAGVGLYALTQIVSALRWQMLAVPLGFPGTLRQYSAYYYIGMYFNLFLPTSVGGDVVRAWYLDGGSGRRMAALVSVLVDRLSGLLVLLTLACVAAICCPFNLPARISTSVWATATGAGLGLLTLPLLARFGARLTRVRPLLEAVRVYLGRPRLALVTTGLSLIVQAANIMLVWLIGWAIGLPVPPTYYWVLVPMVSLLTLLPISFNGVGIREGGMVLFLQPLGIEETTAVSLAVLWFSVLTATSLVGAGIYYLGDFSRPEEQPIYGSVRTDSNQGRARQSAAAA